MPARTRWTAYAGISAGLAGGVILKALAQRPNFYSAAVYLSQSSANLMILTNMIFVIACTVLFGLQKLLYGPLRPIEIEQLYEKAWFAITETCLAMTIFRGEIGAWFLIMFFALLAGKVWGWIGEGRVEILEQQPPRNPRLFHTRLSLSLGLSVVYDLTMLEYVVNQVMRMARPDMMVMFGFEFAVLSISSLSTAARYAIDLVEIGIVRDQKWKRMEEMKKERVEAAQRAATGDAPSAAFGDGNEENAANAANASTTQTSPREATEALRVADLPIDESEVEVEGWEGKGKWVFYLDLTTDFFKLVVYLSFFVILLVFYGLPIHIMRDLFLTCRSFFKRISDFIKYRTATRDMNARYPDATVEDIGREDVCIICREEMRPYQPAVPAEGGQPPPPNPVAERMRPKKLPCGHVLHFSCLRSWLERQQICPTCRTPVLPTGQAGSAGAPGQPGAQPAGAAGHRPGEAVGARVFQFGPLRIGVGAARGINMFEELQQRLANDRGDAAPAPVVNNNAPRQYGFGVRWEGMRRRAAAARAGQQGTLREQLDNIERQIQQEVSALTQSTVELGLLRTMQGELERIRAQRAAASTVAAGIPSVATNQPATATTLPPILPQIPGSQLRVPRVSGFQVDSNSPVLHSGSEHLPAGLTLPEGWSMLPLQPANGIMGPHAQMSFGQTIVQPDNTVLQPWVGQDGVNIANFPVQVPNHVRAMFSNMPGQPAIHATGQPAEAPQANIAQQTVTGEAEGNPTMGNGVAAAPINENLRRTAHERWLASLRNVQPSETTNSTIATTNNEALSTEAPSIQVNGDVTSSSAQASSLQDQRSGRATTPSIPSWGSADVSPHGRPGGQGENTASATSHVDQTNTESATQIEERTDKRATVEDLVEDPD